MKLKIVGKGRGRSSKGICCCDRKVVILEFSFHQLVFLLPNKWTLVYSPEALCLHYVASCTHCTNELDL